MPPALQRPSHHAQSDECGKDWALREARRPELGIDPISAGIEQSSECGEPVDGPDEDGRVDRVLPDPGRNKRWSGGWEKGGAPSVVQRGDPQRYR